MKLSVVDQSPVPAGFTPADALHNSIDLAQHCEALGYNRYWMAEHHTTASLACPAPEIMIQAVASATKRMRVGSGAVLLPHYSPLKVIETFSVLHALHPNRIDLGIGRAPGGTGLDTYALRRHRPEGVMADDFPQQLAELIAFMHRGFPERHPFSTLEVSPSMPGTPELWLLGSSGWSADAASQLGLPYAAAHFINPDTTRRSIEHYHEHFKPSAFLEQPQALVCIGAICADTEEEAQRLHASQRLRRLLRDRGGNESSPIPTPEDALARLAAEGNPPGRADNAEWPRVVVGTTEQVHEKLDHLATELKLDELMIITVIHGHEERKSSYELLARAFGIASE